MLIKIPYRVVIRAPGELLYKEQEVWAESAKEVEDFMTMLGMEVKEIYLPGKKGLWQFNKSELEKACELLGIEWPIRYTRGNSYKHTGAHTLKVKQGWPVPRHYITVTKFLGITRANEITWHELAHAMQSEEASAHIADMSAIDRARAWGYSPRRKGKYPQPSEFEANSYEQCADHWQLLTPIE